MLLISSIIFFLLITSRQAKKICLSRIKILCIGDSLTKGYYGDNKKFHPYTEILQDMLADYVGDKQSVEVVNKGIGGEKIHTDMRERLKKELRQSKYDIVVIMGGVNDLVHLTFEQINQYLFKDILSMHVNANKRGVKSVAMTMLPAKVDKRKLKHLSRKQFEKLRNRVNSKIRKMKNSSSTRKNIFVCDAEKYFPYFSSDRFWTADEVHPSPAGYDRMGQLIFDCIKNTVRKLAKKKRVGC